MQYFSRGQNLSFLWGFLPLRGRGAHSIQSWARELSSLHHEELLAPKCQLYHME